MGHTSKGIPSARCVHHIAYTVPNLEQAIDFFINVIGAELLYKIGPVEDPKGDWMTLASVPNWRAVLRRRPYS